MAGNSRPGGIGPLDPIYDVETAYGSIAVGNSPGLPRLEVIINQDPLQPDPAFDSPIIFDVTFSEETSDFATGDVAITGTAGGVKVATVVDSGDQINFFVYVTGMTTAGSVIANVLASVCHSDATGMPNGHSTSSDNIVQWNGIHPDDVGGLFGWWDATDTGSMTYTGCPERVSSEADLSGNGYTLTPSGTAPQLGVATGVTGGRRCNLFGDGLGNTGYLRNTAAPNTLFSPKAISIFLVCSDRGNNARFSLSGASVTAERCVALYRTSSTNLRLAIGDGNAIGSVRTYDYTVSQTTTTRELRMFTVLVDNSGSDPVVRVDGSVVASAGTSGTLTMTNFLASTPAGPCNVNWGGAPSAATTWDDTISPTAILYSTYVGTSDVTGIEAYLTQEFFTTNEDEYVIPYTGASWSYVVPSGVGSVALDLYGAAGGGTSELVMGGGGQGGRTQMTLATTPAETLTVNVGGAGTGSAQNGACSRGGFNGGGGGGGASPGGATNGGSGGGATDVRQGGSGLANRVAIAGGGGGNSFGFTSGTGGDGGATTGEDGEEAPAGSTAQGRGGTQSAGGAAGTNIASGAPTAGSLGQGGCGAQGSTTAGGGGGGGYYGGGGGGVTFSPTNSTGAGGGGSSYPPSATLTQGGHACHGFATITPN